MQSVRLTQIQMSVTDDRAANLRRAAEGVDRAAADGAEIVCLPEMFTTPYGNEWFPRFAEAADGETAEMLSRAAERSGIVLSGGSFPEREGERLYNTSLLFGPQGQLLSRHRKLHLFDIDLPERFSFRESDTLSAGDAVTVADTPYGRIGTAICFDIRFPELFRLMVLEGAHIILVPAAFNTTTGPAHWHLLARSRAVDNQAFVALTSPARQGSVFPAYGHSLVADPWGDILCEAGEGDTRVSSVLDLDMPARVRRELPFLTARRTDLYQLTASVMPPSGTDI